MQRLSVMVAFVWISQPALAGTPPAAATLFERCAAFVEMPDSAEGQLCDAYVRGFLQGVKAAGGKQRGSSSDETWTDRAARTRLGSAALARASYCVPADLTSARLAELFVQHAQANPKIKDIDARSALEATLYVNYQCTASFGRQAAVVAA